MDNQPTPYVAGPAEPRVDREALRKKIPGWGVDADPADRPSSPREQRLDTGARWTFPPQQPERRTTGRERERSVEHAILPPVFGTAAPLKGLSGAIRRVAYSRYSEGRAAHWLILMAADRVDAIESRLTSSGPLATPVNSLRAAAAAKARRAAPN